VTVVPGDLGSFHSGLFETKTRTRVGHGTLSIYRREDERIDLEFSLKRVSGHLLDNYFHATISAMDAREALSLAQSDTESFLQALSVITGTSVFSATPISMESEAGIPISLRDVTMGTIAVYHLPTFKHQISSAAEFVAQSDEKLNRALAYYKHALILLDDAKNRIDHLSSTHYSAVSFCVLNLWKACAVILGDPAVSGDGYQKRYRKIGLDDDFKQRLERLKDLRDDYDVAHYSLVRQDDVLKDRLEDAIRVAAEAIQAYRRWLDSPKNSPATAA
jgi:hypothetical protein